MDNKHAQEAFQQIDDIYGLIKGNLKGAISGAQMVAVGVVIILIPLLELFFKQAIDPYMIRIFDLAAPYIIFLLRTVFYWSLFTMISRKFDKSENVTHNMLVKKVFDVGIFFPIIPISTAAMLGLIGQADLIAPIMLILIGTLFVLFGQFASSIVSIVAWANIIAGLIGIYVTTYMIDSLWAYLVIYQGLTFIVMGFVLRYMQQCD